MLFLNGSFWSDPDLYIDKTSDPDSVWASIFNIIFKLFFQYLVIISVYKVGFEGRIRIRIGFEGRIRIHIPGANSANNGNDQPFFKKERSKVLDPDLFLTAGFGFKIPY